MKIVFEGKEYDAGYERGMEIKAGMTVWSTVFGSNVEVIRVYKSTATVRVWGRGLAEGKLMTFRGQRLDSLRPKRDSRARMPAELGAL